MIFAVAASTAFSSRNGSPVQNQVAMKFLEGKNPSERKKIIAALGLGLFAVCALFYTFFLSGPTKKPANRANQAKATPSPGAKPITPPSDLVITPIPDNPFAMIAGGDASRNIFAIYEPPVGGILPRPVAQSEPPVIPIPPTPTPEPPPPLVIGFANPATVYAQSGDFQIEVGGDKFTPETKILFNGVEVPTQFGGPQRLVGQVSAQLVANEGARQVMARTPDGKLYSNVVLFNVQAPPTPNFNYVGLVARKRYNNDEAFLQNKQTKEYLKVRLNDPVPDRFRVASISSNEVWVVDTALKLRHRLPFVDEKNAGKAGVTAAGGGVRPDGRINNQPGGFDQNSVQYQEIPGIPSNIPRYVPPQPQPNPNPNKKGNDDEDDDDPNL
ncbi:MAG TPA: hypothetical protein VEX64_10260 [Pyrinomonadaceae bacterium]|nr:hypothetical protein [Pyrinomonadaceae bacterium]